MLQDRLEDSMLMSIERKILLSLDVDKMTDLIEKSSKELGKTLLWF